MCHKDTKKVFNNNPMIIGRALHKFREFTHQKNDIKPSERQMLKTTNNSLIFC